MLFSVVFDIFATMTEDWKVCSPTSPKTQMIEKAILSHRFSKCIIGAYTAPMALLGIVHILAQKSTGSEQPDEQRQLIIEMNLPFEYGASPIYEIVVITQFLLQYTLALTAGMMNTLIVTLVSWFCSGESVGLLFFLSRCDARII